MVLSDSQKWLVIFILSFAALLVYALKSVLMPFLLGFVLAYLSDPLVDRLEKILRKRTISVFVVFIILFFLAVISLLLLIPILGDQLKNLLVNTPRVIYWLQSYFGPLITDFTNQEYSYVDIDTLRASVLSNWAQIAGYLKKFLFELAGSGLYFLGLLAYLLLVPVVTFYLLRDWGVLLSQLENSIPRGIQPKVVKIVKEIDDVLAAFLRGQLTVMLFLAVFYSLGLWLVGIELAFIVGFISGLVSFIPYLGIIVGLLLSLLAFVIQMGDFSQLVAIGIVFLLGQLLEGTVLSPILVGERVGLHPVVVILAVMAGGQLFGFFGVLAAMPVAAILLVLLRHWHRGYLVSDLYRK